MELHEERIGRTTLLVPRGRVDSGTAPELGECLGGLLAGPTDALVLDLSGLEYISSAGFRVLLVANRLARSNRVPMHLCGLSEKVRQLFELAGFEEMFAIHDRKADAMSAIAAGASGAGA